MKNWCKIIELENHDVLLQRLSNNKDDEHIKVTIKTDGLTASYNLGYGEDEARADEAYQEIDKEKAQILLKQTLDLINPTYKKREWKNHT